MRLLSRVVLKLAVLSALVLFVTGFSGGQSSPRSNPARSRQEEPATISRVKILLEKDSPAVEILATRTVVPSITKLENPLRLVIDLPNANMSVDSKRIEVNREDIRAIRLAQYKSKPPAVRVVVDLLKPHSYTWDAAGNRLMVRLHMEGKEVTAKPPSLPVLTKAVQPAAIPVAPPASSGTPVWADKLAAGSSMSTTDDTTVLRLTRGGEIHVCPGTTVSISHSQKGPDLLLGMGTGAVETHYALENSADAIVTPDFRILLRGPGEFHYAIAADSRGNTCVRPLPGNTAPIIVSELMGDGVFRVSPDEPYVFHAGHLSAADTAPHAGRPYNVDLAFPEGCGCPTRTAPPVMLASLPPTPVMPQPNSSAVRLAQAGDQANPLLPRSGGAPPSEVKTPQAAAVRDSRAKDVHIQVEARVVYPAPVQPATTQLGATAQSNLRSVGSARSESSSTLVLGPPSTGGKQVSMDADQPRKPRKSVFGKIKGFFGRVFH
ncbi:MAG TPA: AMIN domain-containing protein [Terriglobales bacterium]|nr:AMIN domain-containing protein [Terriglobales bacterium]